MKYPFSRRGNKAHHAPAIRQSYVPYHVLWLESLRIIRSRVETPSPPPATHKRRPSYPKHTNLTGSSDPIAISVTYKPTLLPRPDNTSSHALTLTVKLYNTTAVTIPNGVKLNLLAKRTSAAVMFKQEILPGAYFDWNVLLPPWDDGTNEEILIQCSFRDVTVESKSVLEGQNVLVEWDDEEQMTEDEGTLPSTDIEEEEDVKTDVVLECRPVTIHKGIMLRPCPLVGDCNTNKVAFRFLWACAFDEREIVRVVKGARGVLTGRLGCGIVQPQCCLNVEEDSDNWKGWSFVSWHGGRLMALLREEKGLLEDGKGVFEVRGDKTLVEGFVGYGERMSQFLFDLTEGEWCIVEGELVLE